MRKIWRTPRGRFSTLLALFSLAVFSACTLAQPEVDLSDDVPEVVDVEVSEDTSTEPIVEFTAPLEIEQLEVTTLVEGDGRELVDGDLVLMQALLVDAVSKEVHINTWLSEPRALHLTVAEAGEGLYTALLGAAPGARILLKEPPTEDELNSGRVVVLDVLTSRVEGEENEPREDLPTVVNDPESGPEITIDQGLEVPSEMVSQTLVKGEGRQVRAGQTVTMNYHGVRWEDGVVIDTTWDDEHLPRSYQVGVGELPSGIEAGIIEQRIGSRILLVLPPADGYPSEGVTVFVLELLAASGEAIESTDS